MLSPWNMFCVKSHRLRVTLVHEQDYLCEMFKGKFLVQAAEHFLTIILGVNNRGFFMRRI